MKEKIKKIIATTLLSTATITAIGCSANGNKLAKNIDKSMADFVSSINNLDYVETGKPTNEKVGKIVETNATTSGKNTRTITSSNNQIKFLNNNVSEAEIENTIVKPSDRQEDKLFVLSDTPFISLTSNDNSVGLTVNVKFSTDKIEEASSQIDEKINKLILKRSILMIYVNEIYNGNVDISPENKTAINAYVNVIKENTSFLNGNRGMVKNQLKLASDIAQKNTNGNLVNYYIIKSGEALETRASKLDSTISAIDAITNIIEDNLSPNSTYYNSKLSETYENLITNFSSTIQDKSINGQINRDVAESISKSLNFYIPKTNEQDNSNQNISDLTEKNDTNINDLTSSTYPAERNNNFTQNNSLNNRNKSLNMQNNRTNPNTNQMQNQNNYLKNNRNLPRQNQLDNSNQNTINARNNNNLQNNNQNFTQNEQNLRFLNDNQRNTNRKIENNLQNKINNSIKTKRTNGTMDNISDNGTKTMRAERIPMRVQNEEYTATNAKAEEDIRAQRVPYKSTKSIER